MKTYSIAHHNERTLRFAGLLLSHRAQDVTSPPLPALHGFGEISMKNAYVTPRGLVVHTDTRVRFLAGAFAFTPYVKIFCALAGDSTVVLAQKGRTFDVEIGLAPSFDVHAIENFPITIAIPTFLTIGGPGFFGDGGRLGAFTTGPSASIPLKLISGSHFSWRLNAGESWYHLLDDNLLNPRACSETAAGGINSSGTSIGC
jgi:hypothetical protein